MNLSGPLSGSGNPRELSAHLAGITCTVIFHLILVTSAIVWGRPGQPEEPEIAPERVIKARLVVRKGEKRPKHLLPRLESPPPPPPPPEAVSLGKVKETKPSPADEAKKQREKEQEQRRRDQESRNRLLSTLSDFKPSKEPPIGDPDGALEGNVDQGARAGSLYAMMVENSLRRIWSVPQFLNREQLIRLKAAILVEIASDGMIESYQMVESSGNPTFDETVEIAIKRYLRGFGTRSFGEFPPNEGLGERFRLRIWFTGASKAR